MKTNFAVLPFYDSIKKTSLIRNRTNTINVYAKVFTTFNQLLPFVVKLGSSCIFEIQVFDYDGNEVAKIKSTQMVHKILSNGLDNYLVYNGEPIGCLELGACLLPYVIKVNNQYSEWFFVASNTASLVKFEISNNKDFWGLPYSHGFKQFFYLDTTLGVPDIDTFTVSSKDERGFSVIKYQKLTPTYNLFLFNIPPHIKQVFSSSEVINLTVSDSDTVVISELGTVKATPKRSESSFENYDIELVFSDTQVQEVGVCDDNVFVSTVCEGISVVNDTDCYKIEVIDEVIVDCELVRFTAKIDYTPTTFRAEVLYTPSLN